MRQVLNPSRSTSQPQARVYHARLAAAAMGFVLACGLALHLRFAYVEAIDAAENLTAALAKAIAERVESDMRAVEALLNETAAAVQVGDDDAAYWPHQLYVRIDRFPELRFIGQIAADGRLAGPIWPAYAAPPSGTKLTDADLSDAFPPNRPARPTVIAAAKPDKNTGGRYFYMVRSLGFSSNGMIAALNADSWAAFLESVLVDPQGAAAIIHQDGSMIARAPDHQSKFALNIAHSDLFTVWLPKKPVGVAQLTAKTDGNDKILAYRTLRDYPLVATCGVSMKTALADWRRMALVETTAALVLLAIAFYWARRADSAVAALEAHGHDLETAVAERTGELAQAWKTIGETAQRLQKVNAELHRLAVVTAHHLQEPLRPMVSYSQLLQQRLQGQDPEADDMLDFIRSAAVRQKALLRDFQRFVSALTEEPRLQNVDCGHAANAAVRAVLRAKGEGTLTATWDDLPTVAADPGQLRDLFRELLINAVQHRGEKPQVRVRIVAARGEDGWTFRVSDDGPGVAEAMREKVFQAFETMAGRNPDSTGLGLPLCRLIIEAHGGDICIEPSAQGTVVRFRLPILPDASENAAP